MSISDAETIELYELFDRLVEKNLSQDQKRKLENWLEESLEARKHYITFMDMHASLCHYADETLSSPDDSEPQSVTLKVVEFARALLPLAALLLFGVYIYWSYEADPELLLSDRAQQSISPGSGEPKSVFYEQAPAEPVAVLTKAVGLVWEDDAPKKLKVGASVYPGGWQMKTGLSQVELMQGATVIFEGRVSSEFLNSNAAVLKRGKMRAHVPKVAVGFSVDLPMGKIVDLGTDFGIHVHEEGSAEVYVYKGKVRYDGTDVEGNEISKELSGGEAIYLDVSGVASSLDMPSGNYLGSSDLASRSLEQAQRRQSAWIELSRRLSSSPGTLLYYGFENHNSWSRTLTDETKRRSGHGNGAVIGCKWTEGRWPGKGALQFSQNNDRVCFNVPNSLIEATLATWIRVDRISNSVAPIIFSRPHIKGAMGWAINATGQLVLAVNTASGLEKYSSPVALPEDRLGKWIHLATTFDCASKWVTHYVNGRSFSKERILSAQSISLKKGLLGHTQAFKGYHRNVALNGCIDEFAIFDSAWGEEDVRELYEVGAPVDVANSLNSIIP